MSKWQKIVLGLLCVSMLLCLNPIDYVMAAGTDGGNIYDSEYVFSYWNIDNVYARTADGRQMLFEFPTEFFYKTRLTEETVTLQSVDGIHSINLRFGGIEINGNKYMAIDVISSDANSTYVELQFTFINNVIYQNNMLLYDASRSLSWNVPLFEIYDSTRTNDITTNAIMSFNGAYSVVTPNPRDDGSVGFDESSGSVVALSSTMLDYQQFYNFVMPQSVVDNVVTSMINKGYTRSNIALYFNFAQVSMLLDQSYATGSVMTIYLPVAHCSDDADYAIGSTMVSLWYDKYANFSAFPSAPDTDLDYGLNEITDFFAIVIGGVFGMEIFPGIYIGGIVFAIFGILFVRATVNFFAGG